MVCFFPTHQTFNRQPATRICSARPDQVEHALKNMLREFKQKFPTLGLQLLIVILPDNNGTLYGKIICLNLNIWPQVINVEYLFSIRAQPIK